MNTMRLKTMKFAVSAVLAAFGSATLAANLGTAFTYQGRLAKDGMAIGSPAPETCSMTFGLYDALTGGSQAGASPIGPLMIDVTNGLFTVNLDFGPEAINGQARWLAITVQCPGDMSATTLTPRQELKPAPHALALPGMYMQQNLTSPNVIGGLHENMVTDGVVGATISGGGITVPDNNFVTDNFGTIGGGCTNQAGDNTGNVSDHTFATVGGGFSNTAGGAFSTISGGSGNNANATGATVTGGVSNMADGLFATVVGGRSNSATADYTLAAGRRALAQHVGAFVWSDSADADFASTGADQFLVRATGGVGINTDAPTAALHLGGTAGVDGLRFPDGTLQTSADTGDTLTALSCADGEIAKWNDGSSSWECAVDDTGGGDITAVNAGTGLSGGGSSGDVTLSIAPGGVGTTELADDSVDSSKIADGSVDSGKIADGAVANVDLAADAVKSMNILDGTISAVDLGTDSVESAQIAADAVGAAEIATDAVGSSELAANSVDTAEIVDGSIKTADLGMDSVTSDKIANDAVGSTEIATDAVGSSEIAGNAVGNAELISDAASLNKVSGGVMTSTGVNIGVGNPAPSEMLDVAGNIKSSGTIQSGNSILINGTSSPNTISTTAGNDLRFGAGGAVNHLYLATATGNVGIGTTAPNNGQLQVSTSTNTENAIFAENTATVFDVPAILGRHQDLTNGRGVGVDGAGGYIGTRGIVNRTAARDGYGLYGEANGGTVVAFSYGVFGRAQGVGINYGIFGSAGSGAMNWAGYFNGNAHVTGILSKGGGAFKIDHPLDPENKYLYHSFVESPDMMNIYNGNVVTNASGYATIQLPDYFHALNRDFRYQLTVIDEADSDSFVQAKVVRGVSDNQFSIRTSAPNIHVSWQVTGVRKDRFAEANRIPTEVQKNEQERGLYAHPEAYGLPEDRGIDFKQGAGAMPMLESIEPKR